MSDQGILDFLTTVPLLEGIGGRDLAEVAQVMRERTVSEGEILWREGEDARDMAVIVAGRVSVSMRVPGDGTVEICDLGPGEALGEIPLLDGGQHSATVRVTEPTTLLTLSRPDFVALVSRRHPSGLALKRRIAAVNTGRLRDQLGDLAASLGARTSDEPAGDAARAFEDLELCGPPNSKYIRRMATFRAFDSLALWGFLTTGRYARCKRGDTLQEEGAPPTACYLTINGAVEKLIIRRDRRIRVGLAGPGHAFGYAGLIDGGACPETAIARERALLLVLPPEAFQRLFHGEQDESHVFLDVVNRDLTASLRQAQRPQAHLAISGPGRGDRRTGP